MDQRNCLKFCVKKTKLNEKGHLKCWLWSSASVLWAEHKFNCGIYNQFKEGREDVNDEARPGRPTMSTTDEKIEAVKKMILDKLLERLLVTLAYNSAYAKQFLRMF